MNTRDIEAFVNRDWRAVRASKDSYWIDRIARLGAEEAFRVADELRHQMAACDPQWPDDRQRQADFAAHQQLSETFRRAGRISGR